VLQRLWKPWFVYRPLSWYAGCWQPRGHGLAATRRCARAGGADLIADPTRTIGYSILTTDLHDLAVSEALFRLISPATPSSTRVPTSDT
jgi:hypothetical protein